MKQLMTLFSHGLYVLDIWYLFDINIYPSFETLGEQRLLKYLLSPKRRVHKYLCPSPLVVQKIKF